MAGAPHAASAELQVVAFTTISAAATGGASTLFNVQRQVGSALGVALTACVLAGAPGLGGYHLAMAVSAGLALVGAALALRIAEQAPVREPAAAVSRPRITGGRRREI